MCILSQNLNKYQHNIHSFFLQFVLYYKIKVIREINKIEIKQIKEKN